MKQLLLGFGLLFVGSSCVSPKIPDDVPPPPPMRKGDPYTAPSVGDDADEVEDGFGGEGFGGETPTMEVDAAEEVPEEGEMKAAEGDKKKADPKKKKGEEKEGTKKKAPPKEVEDGSEPEPSSEN